MAIGRGSMTKEMFGNKVKGAKDASNPATKKAVVMKKGGKVTKKSNGGMCK